MVKQTTLVVDRAMMTAIAAISTIVAGNILATLYNRGIIDDDAINQIIADTADGGLGDPSLDAMAQSLAGALRARVNASMN